MKGIDVHRLISSLTKFNTNKSGRGIGLKDL